jgi:two-component system response regulator LytT
MSLITKILVVEDEILIADYIKELLQTESFTAIRMAHDPETALNEMATFLPDIILMDINLKGKNSGIDLAKHKNQEASLIFLTGQNDPKLMHKALESNPEAYLTKPIKKNDLIAAIRLQILKQKLNYVTIKVGYEEVKLILDEILFIKSENNYIDIQMMDKKYTIRQSLNTFLDEIKSKDFIRIHRSFIVNQTKISSKNSTSVFIENFEIPCSRNTSFNL